ncbi:MAG: iron-containing alcohol dehydrogenase [Lachnospiraceae bacterium]|nr:iron-containing alcohol dehydrogenase [Lachnospiraceae bacterium]
MFVLRRLYCRMYQKIFHAAIPFMPYREPRHMKQIEETVFLLRKKRIKRALIVTDSVVRELGLTKRLEDLLGKVGIVCTVYDGTVPNPTIDNVEEARQMYVDGRCQAVVAVGGGSAMDCAKVCAARIVKPGQPVYKMKGLLKIHKRLPLLIAVPTTAGTGSETTLAAVITDAEKHHKYPINDFSLIPHYAVLDYRLTLGLPKTITATTGMDALTHAVEAYIGRSTTANTRRRAECAVKLIRKYLKKAYDDGNDKMARSAMLRAAYYAGIAFTQSYVGYVHAIAHSLGGQYGTPHGLANAVLLPIMLREYGESCEKKLAALALNAGVVKESGDRSEHDIAGLFIDWVQHMNDYMGIPRIIDGIHDEDIDIMAEHADAEANPLYPVPRLMNKRELSRMYYVVAGKVEEV